MLFEISIQPMVRSVSLLWKHTGKEALTVDIKQCYRYSKKMGREVVHWGLTVLEESAWKERAGYVCALANPLGGVPPGEWPP